VPVGVRHEVDVETALSVADIETLIIGVFDAFVVDEPGTCYEGVDDMWCGE
jgi:hypothetical protein